MSSLFARWRRTGAGLLKLPSECVPGDETDTLRAKRDAVLKWMRERGVRYLGNPMVYPDRRAPGSPIAPPRDRKLTLENLADERPGDAIVRDLAGTAGELDEDQARTHSGKGAARATSRKAL
jgi:hypothetical protein